MASKRCPFSQSHQLVDLEGSFDFANSCHNDQKALDDKTVSVVPGQPALKYTEHSSLTQFLRADLLTTELDAMSRCLWMMTTPSSDNIRPLHRQIVMGRRIIVTEEPRLHLVWLQDRIYIKPLPRYLLSHSFWTNVILSKGRSTQHDVYSAALGFIRTYRHLIRHESDFLIAQRAEAPLIPRDATWADISWLLSDIQAINDLDVPPRYHFGELRLSRLNFYAKFSLRKFHYERLNVQYGTYFSQFYGPLLFVFGILSICLNAMQVELDIEQLPGVSGITLRKIGRWFSISTLAWLLFVCSGLLLIFLYLITNEWQYAIRQKMKPSYLERRDREASEEVRTNQTTTFDLDRIMRSQQAL